MQIIMLKLSMEKDELLSSKDILSMHLGYLQLNGKVTYSTNIAIANKPDYVILTLGNIPNVCYLCQVYKYGYDNTRFIPEDKEFNDNSPELYKLKKCNTWLIFNSMVPIQADKEIINFIKCRANYKIIERNISALDQHK